MGIGPREPKFPTLCVRYFLVHLQIACTKMVTVELMDVSRLWGLNEQKVEELLHLLVFRVLEVKDGLDRADRINK